MFKFKLNFKEAKAKVKEIRPDIRPNKGFKEQLLKFEGMRCQKKGDDIVIDDEKPRKQRHGTFVGTTANLPDINYSNSVTSKEKDENINTEEFKSKCDIDEIYLCQNCRGYLFQGKDTKMHINNGEDKALDATRLCNKDPTMHSVLYVHWLTWMEQQVKTQAGRLHCPHCRSKIGFFKLNGLLS